MDLVTWIERGIVEYNLILALPFTILVVILAEAVTCGIAVILRLGCIDEL